LIVEDCWGVEDVDECGSTRFFGYPARDLSIHKLAGSWIGIIEISDTFQQDESCGGCGMTVEKRS
jgi:hypothetical protein